MVCHWRLLILLATCLGSALSGVSVAQDGAGTASVAAENRFYVSPMASYTIADPDRGTDDGIGGTLAVGRMFGSQFGIELEAVHGSYDPDRGGDTATLTGGGLRGVLFPSIGNYYGLLGLGYGRFKDHPGTDTAYDSVLVTLGLGYVLGPFDFIANGIWLRAEAALRSDVHGRDQTAERLNNALNEGLFNLGLLIPLGTTAQPPPPLEPTPIRIIQPIATTDSDGDGIADAADQCPGTPSGASVDGQGCPPAPPAPACDSGAAGIELGGCEPGQTLVLHGVNFAFDQAVLTANARTLLDQLVLALKASPHLRIEIGGHTDARGGDAYNQALSARRAHSVVDYLVGQAIAPQRLQAVGYGETAPLADNQTEAGRQLNRRVALRILE